MLQVQQHRFDADYQGAINAQKQAEALGKLGGDAYVKMQVAKPLSQKRIWLVPGTNVSTMDVNPMVNFLMGRTKPAPRETEAQP